MNRKETNMDTIELKGHQLTIDEKKHSKETVVRLTSNDDLCRTISIHIDNDGDLQVFARGLNMKAGNIKKRTKSLHGTKYIVLSPKKYVLGQDHIMDRMFIDV